MKEHVPAPPIAPRHPHPTNIHSVTLADDYAWLREKDSPAVTTYLETENAYTAAAMSGTEELQQDIYDEILSHIKENDVSVPYRDGAWMYWTRTEKGLQYPRFCRRSVDSPPTTEHIILDINLLAAGKPFMSIGDSALSPDGRLLAYTTDETGFRQYTLAIKNLETGENLTDTAERVGSLVWAADSSTLFYTTENEQTKRQDRAFRHILGDPITADIEIFHEPDERFNLGLGRTTDRQLLLLEASSHTTNEIWLLSTSTPTASFKRIAPRIDDEEYHIDHRDGFLYIHTNHDAEQFRLMRAPTNTPSRDRWQEILAEKAEAPLEDFDLFQNFLVAAYRERGLPVLRVFSLDSDGRLATHNDIRFPDPAYSASGEINRDFNTASYRYSYQSLVRPPSVFSFDVATQESTLLKQQEVPGGFDATNYDSARLWFPAHDGTQVPISLVYRKDKFAHDGKSPLYVYGYGSYGYPLPLGFSTSRLALLDRGIVAAYAHVRGGGELGDPWHDAGKMMHKRNTFTDFIEAVEILTREKYGDPARVVIEGGSAGGLLMGAAVNIAAASDKSSLFSVVLSHVPFVDVMNTMLDATLPLTVAEYEEWGNPNELAAFNYMLSYSPYDNLETLRDQPIPAMLVKTSLNDSQVMYWEPAKYVAKLRTIKSDSTPLLLHINMDAGHGGASGRYDYLKETAFDYAFLLRELGIETVS